ncbi:MAG TPA: copper oxidase [Propionibacteriaceae bacterium]|nr:copper oxidase [Propionibacteriaceae bacterium]
MTASQPGAEVLPSHNHHDPGAPRDLDRHQGLARGRENHSAGHHGTDGRAGDRHDGHQMTSDVTEPQLAVVTVLTVLALALAVALPATRVNLTLSADEIGGAIMPPGMVMTRETSADAMRDMAAIDQHAVDAVAPAAARGDQPLEPRTQAGVKIFDLTTAVTGWSILPERRLDAYTVNGQVPGPRLRVTQGDRVRVNVHNRLPEATSIHWHGLVLPNAMDGAADITQPPIPPGGSHTYEFTVSQQGTYFYHSHAAPDRQQALDLYGALLVDPTDSRIDTGYDYDHEAVIQLQEWLTRDGLTFPAMSMEGALPNYFTINGKSYPETETIRMRVGEKVRVRFIGTHNNFVHPMHIHGGPFRIVQTDGEPVPPAAQLLKDTVNVGPGERYDVIWEAREPGKWLLHCHIPHHTTNDNAEQNGGGGLMAVLDVSE